MKALGPPAARFLVLFSLTAKVLTCVRGTCPVDTAPPAASQASRQDRPRKQLAWEFWSPDTRSVVWRGPSAPKVTTPQSCGIRSLS